MIELTVNGTPYTDFTQASVSLSINSLSNDFSFTASAVNLFPPFKNGDEVEVLVNGIKRLTGYIEEINGTDQEGNHTIVYSGRDKTGDFIDSSLIKFDDVRGSDSLTLKKIIELIISNIGTNIKVIDLLKPKSFNLAEDIIDANDGTNAYSLAIGYARKRQALLSSDESGNIVIMQSSPIDSKAILQRLKNCDCNNILSQSWSIQSSQQFNLYIHKGQNDPRALNFSGDTDIATVENQDGRIIDQSARIGRQSVKVESKGYSSAQLVNRAKWTKQIAKARATRFNCSAKGHEKPQGGDWIENTLVQINSDSADINRKMLINTITFSEGEGQPTITNLEFVEQNVYTIDEKILSQKPVGSQNDIFK